MVIRFQPGRIARTGKPLAAVLRRHRLHVAMKAPREQQLVRAAPADQPVQPVVEDGGKHKAVLAFGAGQPAT